jgi:ribosome-associated translation inhibitor RaiA
MTMVLNISKRVDDDTIETSLRDRLELAVGQFHDRIARIDAVLDSRHGEKRHKSFHCVLDIHLVPSGHLHVQGEGENISQATSQAIHRAEAVIAKAVERSHRGAQIRHNHGGLGHASVAAVDELAGDQVANDQVAIDELDAE